MKPRISVVMPLYNKGLYVEQAIASAIAAVPPVHEIIVVDDGSTDDGPQRVQRFLDKRVKLIRQPNRGVSVARNTGIRAATGNFIAFLDADDMWTPDYLPEIYLLMARYPDASVFATHFFTFDERGLVELPELHDSIRQEGPQLVTRFFEAWVKNNIFYTCSVVLKRDLFFENNIFFPENESLGEDQDVWFQVAEKFPVAYSARKLVGYRVGMSGSLSKTALYDLPPFVQRLNERYDRGCIPSQHRKGVSRVLGLHRLTLALKYLRANGWARGVALLFDRFSIRLPKYWLKIFLLACLPRPLRLYVLEKL